MSVRFAADRPVSELVARLAAHLGLEPGSTQLYVSGRPVGANGSGDIAGLNLRMGDKLWLVGGDELGAECSPSGLRMREARALRAQAPDPADLQDRARMVWPTLWERRPHRPGFLRLRLGWGDMPSAIRVEYPMAAGMTFGGAVAEVSSPGTELRLRLMDSEVDLAGIPDLVDVEYAERVARSLSGIEALGASAARTALPRSVGLIECLDIRQGGDLAAAVRQR